jgi:hypothetical protein
LTVDSPVPSRELPLEARDVHVDAVLDLLQRRRGLRIRLRGLVLLVAAERLMQVALDGQHVVHVAA